MKKIRILIIVSVILIIAIISFIILFNSKTGKQLIGEEYGDPGEEESFETNNTIRLVENREYYYTVQSIVQSYIYSIMENDSETLLNTLDPEYINEYNINENNVVDRLNNFAKDVNEEDIDKYKILIEKMYYSEQSTINTFFVKLKVINRETELVTDTSIIVEMDLMYNVYYILPYEYMEKNNYLNIQENSKYEFKEKTIEANDYNEYEIEVIENDATIISDLMDNFTDNVIYNLDNSYDLFSEEYKKERFNTLDKYKDYMNNNINKIISSSIKKYRIDTFDDYNQYIFIDQNGNYYIFKETTIMEYTVQLDTYTIDSQDFKDRYDDANEQTKVGMNIEKIKQALNNKDYEYVYNKLDNTFKQNNFGNYEQFVSYIKENLFEINKIEYINLNREGDIYAYETKITQANEDEEEQSDSKKGTFIMKLLEDRDFVMSFSIE